MSEVITHSYYNDLPQVFKTIRGKEFDTALPVYASHIVDKIGDPIPLMIKRVSTVKDFFHGKWNDVVDLTCTTPSGQYIVVGAHLVNH